MGQEAETDFDARMRLAKECGSLAQQLASAKDHIASLENKAARTSASTLALECEFGPLTCLVEFEIDEASGDGWNEPRHEASADVVYVWIAGERFDSDHFSSIQRDIWEEQALDALKQGAEA